ncbi:conserved membrane hypothetical protein [Xenorhabdus bovienii str. puntauvense]|uniref:Uncharacterized protein n=1 Tax=Xenorhabdus bovienii str. puntauvense TaxID=1398201 RepID=A0A077N5J5_XENBV|nr:hypothetical protein [Xenorhabdus bovienii]CDG97401.1 conserved membrane hypothetical protein [Xenorhabdus bovienii str. puntauvense]
MRSDNSNDFMIEVFKFCLEKGKFKISDFNEKFGLSTDSSIDLIGKLIYEGAVDETNEVAVYCVTEGVTLEKYIKFRSGSDFKIKETKANTSKVKIAKENTQFFTSQRVLALVTIAVVLVSLYFLTRSIIWLVVMAVLTFFIGYFYSAVEDKKFPHAIILGLYIVAMPVINMITPVFGEKYIQRVELKEANKILKDMEYKNLEKVSMAEYSVKQMLKDPSSAKFSGSRLGSNGAVCGYVNSKNSFGAYAGKQRYVSSNGLNVIDNGEPNFEPIWKELCR